MKRVLENIEPKNVFEYFEDLTRIPRGSGNEDKVCQYLIDFAEKNGYSWHKDDMKNLLIRVPATPGYENHPTVIIQGHTDMVCEKNQGTEHDFEKDPIKIEIEGDKIIAKETTLGADDGMGIALAMAVASDKTVQHPPLEIVCTSDEERGMTGVEAFDTSLLKGRKLINLDADDEGVFVVGCAGGPVVRIEIPISWESIKEGYVPIEIKITGLKGGHSGEDIHRGRANSNKLLSRVLNAVELKTDYQLAKISGGLKYNAIPREAGAIIYVPSAFKEDVISIVKDMEETFKKEFYSIENDLSVAAEEYKGTCEKTLSEESKNKIVNFVTLSQCGIMRMNPVLEGVVESSVSIGVVWLEEDKAVILTMTRSSSESMYMDMYYNIVRLAKLMGGTTYTMSNCPEWEYNPHSEIKNLFESTYKELFNKEPKFLVLHAGLECGVFAKKIPEYVDMIAAGPDIRDLHTPGEYVTISSVQKFWKFFKEVFKRL
jgi:dipeptidase D